MSGGLRSEPLAVLNQNDWRFSLEYAINASLGIDSLCYTVGRPLSGKSCASGKTQLSRVCGHSYLYRPFGGCLWAPRIIWSNEQDEGGSTSMERTLSRELLIRLTGWCQEATWWRRSRRSCPAASAAPPPPLPKSAAWFSQEVYVHVGGGLCPVMTTGEIMF